MAWPNVRGWSRQDPPHLFDRKALGYSVRYGSPLNIRVDVYVYNAGLRSIPDDLGAPVVRDQFERAKGDVHAARRQGLYQSVEELSQGEARLGRSPDAPRAHHARFRIARGDEKLVSDLYLTVHRDHFVKIRCSRPDTEDAQRQAALAELLDALGTMLRASKTISWENVREQGSASALALSLDRWERDTRSP
ncbi:MAG: hypothetical protein NUV77_09425 [Thermoguttaceae bacterium]|nr:hypothetical protein [Thermoguttaceae bacterium]